MTKVIVGMSGGVDSAVAAYLLKMSGYDVTGVTLKTWMSQNGQENRCCRISDAEAVSAALGIPYYVHNCINEFEDRVTKPFMKEYINGRTPNPCVECNRHIKWEKLLEAAAVLHADYVATGHYAFVKKLQNGRYTLKRASSIQKDQTYMLYALTQEQLSHTLMPLGELDKNEVRHLAEYAGIPVAQKADSQEICFVTEGRYADYIYENYDDDIPKEGDFVDEKGNILGKHKGIIHYTIGQRKGLELALGYPVYVKEICPQDNTVIVGCEDSLYKNRIACNDLNFMGIPKPEGSMDIRCFVKIRYHHKAQEAKVRIEGTERAEIEFDEPVRAATAGQSAVFYDNDGCVIGGGKII